jgi:hypothetical protein
MIKIPADALSPAALEGVIDDYVTREGTDYGHRDYSLEEKRAAVRAELAAGRAVVTYDPRTGTTTIVPAAASEAVHAEAGASP